MGWQRAQSLRQAYLKAMTARQRTARRLAAAVGMHAKATDRQQAAESEHDQALETHEQRRLACLVSERELASAEAALSVAEAEQAGEKRRRTKCKAALGAARGALRPAKAAEKEAASGKNALMGHYTRTERVQVKQELEASVTSAKEAMNAVQALRAEEYDANQVEEAYQAKKRQRQDVHTDNID